MTIDYRAIITTLSLPVLLFSLGLLLAPQMDLSDSSLIGELFPWLPYLLCLVGLLLSWIFYHGREFSQLLLIGTLFGLIYSVIWQQSTGDIHTPLLYQLLCLMLPLNFVINQSMQNRGIWNRYGIERLFILAFQLLLIALLVKYPPQFFIQLFGWRIAESQVRFTDISPVTLLFTVVTAAMFTVRHFLQPSLLTAGNLGAFLVCMVGIHYIRQPPLLTLFFIIALLIIIATITLNAYALAYQDELTRLPSRRALKQAMMALGSDYCIAMVDVDHFKKLNDTHGHDTGDQVLRMLAAHLRSVRGGKAYRYGGEEFTLLFSDRDIEQVVESCEQLCVAIARSPFIIRSPHRPQQRPGQLNRKQKGDTQLKVTVSIGLSARSEHHQAADDVIKDADKALYKAKKNGRNQVVLHKKVRP